LNDFPTEALRILEKARGENIPLRLVGALAFHYHCPNYMGVRESLSRKFTDIDFISYSQLLKKVRKLFTDLGYKEDFYLSRLYSNRLLFEKEGHIDVFFDKLTFCHVVPLTDRLEIDDKTIPLAELLLTKMQIVELNRKDVIDSVVLIAEHDIGESDRETINSKRIAHLLSNEWGFYHTVTSNLKRLKNETSMLQEFLGQDGEDMVNRKIDELLDAIEKEPKSSTWKIRAKIGTRKKWYKTVEEIG
jgi:hypothetical protein